MFEMGLEKMGTNTDFSMTSLGKSEGLSFDGEEGEFLMRQQPGLRSTLESLLPPCLFH